MPGTPRRRGRREAGETVSWREDPSLSSRAPFEAGNLKGRRHGVYRPEELAPVAEELAAELVEVAPWCAAPAFGPTVERWAWAEAACRAYRDWFHEHGLVDEDGPRAGQERWARFEATAARCADSLGLSPYAMAKLLGTLSVTAVAAGDADALEHLRAEGRRILEARQLAAVPDDDAPDDAA
jgi:hypothetical protein